MKQDSLIGLGYLERITDVLRGPSLEISKCDHLSLRWRQSLDRLKDYVSRLSRKQSLLRRLESSGPDSPAVIAAGRLARVVRREEAVGVHRGLVVTGARRGGERDAAP